MPTSGRQPPPDECAQCGEVIPPKARACPHCGADERTGWRETSIYDGLDLPEDDEADDNGTTPSGRRRDAGLRWYWVVTFVVVLILLILGALGQVG